MQIFKNLKFTMTIKSINRLKGCKIRYKKWIQLNRNIRTLRVSGLDSGKIPRCLRRGPVSSLRATPSRGTSTIKTHGLKLFIDPVTINQPVNLSKVDYHPHSEAGQDGW